MEEALTALLLANSTVSSLTGSGDRIWWDIFEQGKTGTAARLSVISDLPDHHTAGPSGLVESRVQIDCRSQTKAQAKALARAIQAALDGYSGTISGVRFHPILKVGGQSRFEKTDAERFYLVSDDYQIWSGAAA